LWAEAFEAEIPEDTKGGNDFGTTITEIKKQAQKED